MRKRDRAALDDDMWRTTPPPPPASAEDAGASDEDGESYEDPWYQVLRRRAEADRPS